MNASTDTQLGHWRRNSGVAGAAALAAWAACAIFRPAHAFQAYWFAWVFWTGLGLGALSVLMLQYLLPSAWGDAVRNPAEAASLTLPLMALLFVPACFGIASVFPWAHPGFTPHNWAHKRQYLTAGWLIIRSAGYLVTAILLAFTLRRYRRMEERSGSLQASSHLRSLSAAGLVFYGGLMLFVSTDWFMALEPEWYSTMPVVIVMAGQFISALSFSTVVAIATSNGLPRPHPLAAKQLHDLGNVLLAFVTFWIYVSFSQFLIIWAGDQPREIGWYLHRNSGGWQYVAAALALCQFAIPFALLLSRAAKQHSRRLLPIAALIFAAGVLNSFWLITPAFAPGRPPFPWLEATAFVGVGGCWLATFLAFFEPQRAVPAIMKEEAVHA